MKGRELEARETMSSSNQEVVPEAPVTNPSVHEDGQFADDGDGDFIPVVKEKRKNKAAEKQQSQGDKAQAGAGSGGEKATKSGGRGAGSSRRRGRRSAAAAAAGNASANAVAGGAGESGQPEVGVSSDNGTADEHSNDDTPKKFVEAPIPAVNVWKVSWSYDRNWVDAGLSQGHWLKESKELEWVALHNNRNHRNRPFDSYYSTYYYSVVLYLSIV